MEPNVKQSEVLESVRDNRITLVEAPPGTGKTYTAVLAAICFVKENLSKNKEFNKKVLILTFSKNARAQIVKQLEKLNDGKINYDKYIEISNYHSFYQKYIWAYSNYLELSSDIGIMAPQKRKKMITDLLIRKGIETPSDNQINWASDLLEGDFRPKKGKKAKEIREISYLKDSIIEGIIELNKKGEIYYSDFGFYMEKLISKSKDLFNILKLKYPLIILDEYQDSSDIQESIVRKLISDENKGIFFADSNQMIYEWRGAKATRIDELISFYGYEINCVNLDEIHRYKNKPDIQQILTDIINDNYHRENYKKSSNIDLIDVNVDVESLNMYSQMIKNKCYAAMKYKVLGVLKGNAYKTVGILTRGNEMVNYLKNSLIKDFKINLNELCNNELEHDLVMMIHEFITSESFDNKDSLTRLMIKVTFELTYEKEFGTIKRKLADTYNYKNISRVRNETMKKIKEVVLSIDSMESFKGSMIIFLKFLKKSEIATKNNLIQLIINQLKIKDYNIDKVTSMLLQQQYIRSFKDLKGEYILNVHQSKGREFDEVIIVDSNSLLNDKKLFYVALSRAKERIILLDWKVNG